MLEYGHYYYSSEQGIRYLPVPSPARSCTTGSKTPARLVPAAQPSPGIREHGDETEM
ncbi:uncharacterized protein MYCGRDRAFT_106705 [Zymoseptoria tritici IPO323]|uniref:Uncharacterized protein n=1 Tax=Zymoseptoria tritici (strain CBS 115943 / IPO323) TaxID=336722 RepID=F9XS72_ZYMTI|nr:uncharacterized protein MYCGRDRAFT_106705 [Zymoseptoria tritici IPO323]EGP81927.1 hypothetical protein MYCGRDRAFT_106705 [Zymoseptoria tritici IPO323]